MPTYDSMKLEDHVYNWEQVVVGGDLRSILYALSNNFTLLFTHSTPPFRFDMLDLSVDATKLGFLKDTNVSHLEVWERMFFYAGLLGLIPLSSKAENIRVKDHSLIITTSNQRVIKSKFKKLIIFDNN